MRFISVLTFSISCVLIIQANIFIKDSTQKTNHQPILIDVLRQRYFSIEDALWHVITSGLEQSYVLQQVHSGHKTFLQENFTEKNCYFSTFDPDQHTLYEAIRRISQAANETVGKYLHSARHLFNDRDALSISIHNQNLTYPLDQLFEKTGNTDFYAIIRNVSLFCVH